MNMENPFYLLRYVDKLPFVLSLILLLNLQTNLSLGR